MNYGRMTKPELIKKIKELEKKSTEKDKEFSPGEKEDMVHDIEEKQVQIEIQRYDLIEAQNLLEQSRDKYADLYDYAPTGYVTLNEHGIIKESNFTFADMLGKNREHIINMPFLNYLAEENIQNFLSMLRKCKKNFTQSIIEAAVKDKNNESFIVLLSTIPFNDYLTKKINFRVSMLDITDRKKAEKKLKESESRFRSIADASSVMIWMTDENCNLIYTNKTKLNFMGKDGNNLCNDDLIDMIHPDDKAEFQTKWEKAVKEKSGFKVEIRTRNRSEKYRWIYEIVLPRFLSDKEFAGFIGSGVDMTENVEVRNELKRSLKEKEVLLKEIHHRVKNNLQIISSLLNLQAASLNSDLVRDAFQVSQDRIRSMSLLHEKLYQSNNLQEINIEDYIRNIASTLFNTYRNKNSRIDLRLNIEKIDLEIELSLNIGLIVTELLTNALKHAFPDNRNGEIKILLNLNPHNEIELRIEDNGVGLPKDFDMKKVTTLGIELANSLAWQHHGNIEINNNGKTEFFIKFPLHNPPQKAV